MTGTQAIILLVSISSLIAGTIGWKTWLAYKENIHQQQLQAEQQQAHAQQTLELSKQETERLKLVAQAMKQEPAIQKSQQSLNEFKDNLAKKLKPNDQINVNGQPIIDGARAAVIVPKPKEKAVETRIDGEFVINEVKFPQKFGEPYRFTITRILDQKSLIVEASPDKISHEQVQILKEGGFGIKKVIMQINAKVLREHIAQANLVSISWPE